MATKTRQSLAQPDLQFGNESGIPASARQKLDRLTQSVRAIMAEIQKIQQAMAGGTVGQVLEKNGPGDYAASWAAAPGGTVTGAENLGAGVGLFKSLSAGVLGFKTLIAGANITFSASANALTIAATSSGAGTGTVTSVGINSADFDVIGSPITDHGSIELEIKANAVTNPKLAQMAPITVKGNPNPLAANAQDITVFDLTALLFPFTTTSQGVVPAPGTATGAFLADDGAWHVPFGQLAMKDPLVVGTDDSGIGQLANQDTSICVLIPARNLVNLCQSWRVAFRVQTGPDLLIAKAVLRRANRYLGVFIDSTVITFGGLGAFTLANGVDTLSDAIAMPMDRAHDYYVMFYVDAAASPTALVPLMTDATTGLLCGVLTGDHTADADNTAFTFTNVIYGVVGAFVETGNGWGSPLTTKGDILTHSATVDTRLGVGADNLVLTADSTAPNGIAWKAATGASPLTTKGDLYGFDTANARLPVGANGTVVAADSTATLGVAYKTLATLLPVTTKGDLLGWTSTLARVAVGIDGKVLTADSAAAAGFSWQTVAGASPLTTKGDLYGFSTVNVRVAVGTDGQFLMADSAATAGVSWQGSSCLLYGSPDFAAPPSAGWTWLAQGSSTVASVYSGRALRFTAVGATSDSLYVRTVTPGTFTVTACLMVSAFAVANFSRVGLYWRDSVTGRMQMFVIDMRATPVPLAQYNFSNLTTFNATIWSGQNPAEPRQFVSIPLWLRVTRDVSNNIRCYISDEGVNFNQVSTTDAGNYVASPDQIGVGFSNSAAAGAATNMTVMLYSFAVGP